MLVVMTFFKKNQISLHAHSNEDKVPVGLKPCCYGVSLLERNLNILKQHGMTELLMLTDDYQELLEQCDPIQSLEKIEVQVLTVTVEEGSWKSPATVGRLCEYHTDVFWIRGDLLCTQSAIAQLCKRKRSCILKAFQGTTTVQSWTEPFGTTLIDEIDAFEGKEIGCGWVPALKIKAEDIQKLKDYYISTSQSLKFASSIDLVDITDIECPPSAPPFSFGSVMVPHCFVLGLSGVEFSEEEILERVRLLELGESVAGDFSKDILEFQSQICGKDKNSVLLIQDQQGTKGDAQEYLTSILPESSILSLIEVGEGRDSKMGEALAILSCGQIETLISCGGQRAANFACELAEQYHLLHISAPMLEIISVFVLGERSYQVGLQAEQKEKGQNMPRRILAWPTRPIAAREIELYSYILSVCISGHLLRNKGQAIAWSINKILSRLTSYPLSDRELIRLTIEAGKVENLCGSLPVHAIARTLQHETKCSFPYALLYASGVMVAYLKTKLRMLKLNCQRRIASDALDEIFIACKVANQNHLMDIVYTILSFGGITFAGFFSQDTYQNMYRQITEEEERNSLFVVTEEAIKEMLEGPVVKRNLFSTERTYLRDKRTAVCFRRSYTFLSGYAERARWEYAWENLLRTQKEILKEIATCCQKAGINFWLLDEWRETPESDLCLEESGYTVAIRAVDMGRFADAFSGSSSDYRLDYHCNYTPAAFASAAVFKRGTRWENRWNINAVGMRKEIFVPIREIVSYPQSSFSTDSLRLQLANTLNQIICKKEGYYLPALHGRFTRIAPLFEWVDADVLKKWRSHCLKLLGRGKEEKTEAVINLGENMVRPVNFAASSKVSIGVNEYHVLTVQSDEAAKGPPLPSLFSETYQIFFGPGKEFLLAEPNLKISVWEPLIRRIFSRAMSQAKKVYRKVMGTATWKQRRAKLHSWTRTQAVRFVGFFRGLGICISPASRKLKSYRGKYKGQRCFLIGNGPSLCAEDLDKLKREITFGCNFIHKIYGQTDWRPTYHCISDSSTVRTACWDIVRHLDSKKTTMIIREFAYRHMPIKPQEALLAPYVSTENYKVRGNFLAYHRISRATVMSMMLEAAVYMGFSEIYLIGVDATTSSDKGGNFAANYFTPEVRSKLNTLKKKALKDYDVIARRKEIEDRQQAVYEMLREYAEKRNIKIFNATRGGALEVFERVNLDHIIQEKGLGTVR